MRAVIATVLWVVAGGFTMVCLGGFAFIVVDLWRSRAARRRLHGSPVLYVYQGGRSLDKRPWCPPGKPPYDDAA